MTAKKKMIDLYSDDQSIITLANLDEYNLILNQQPPGNWIKINKFANNSKYLPIDKVEYLLRRLYKTYDIEVLNIAVLFNAVSVTVRLHYFHPVLKEMKFVDGVGAKEIQTSKGGSPSDMSSIINGAVERALPIAKTNAQKDACHHLGKIFGSDLNRKDIIEDVIDTSLQDKKTTIERERLLLAIENGYKPTEQETEKYGI